VEAQILLFDQRLCRWAHQSSEAPSWSARGGLVVGFESSASATHLFHLDGEGISAEPQPRRDLATGTLFSIEQSPGLRGQVAELGDAYAPPLPFSLDLRPEVLGPWHGVILALDLSVGHRESRRQFMTDDRSRRRRTDPTTGGARTRSGHIGCRARSESFVRHSDVSPSVSVHERCAREAGDRALTAIEIKQNLIIRSD
jgi:hypothetical protein